MPPHKRCVLLDRKPVILEGDIMYNLRFGILPENHKRISDATCWAVAKTLGLSAELIGTAHPVAGAGLEKLTSRDAVAISLAQMFLSEPGIVLVDHIGDSLGREFVQHILRPFLEAYTLGGLREILGGLHQNDRVKEVQMMASCDLGKKHVETELPSPPVYSPTVIWTSLVVTPHETDYTLHMKGTLPQLGLRRQACCCSLVQLQLTVCVRVCGVCVSGRWQASSSASCSPTGAVRSLARFSVSPAGSRLRHCNCRRRWCVNVRWKWWRR